MEGVSFVIIELLQSANIDISLQEAQRKVGEISNQFPTDAKTPVITKFAIDELPILRMGVSSNMKSQDLYQFVKDKLQPQLTRIDGVGQIAMVGGEEREVKVNIDLQKMKSYGFSLLQIVQLIKSSNLDFPTGSVKDSDGEFIVRVAGKFSSIDELRNLFIGESRTGGGIKLSDIAEIEDGIKDSKNITRINFRNTIGLNLQKQSDANAVQVAYLVKKQITKLEQQYKHYDLKFTVAQDGSLYTIDAVNAVKEDLAIAVCLVAIVMLMFLHSIRNSLIIMVAIPASLISTMIAIYALGFTLNLMTLLGLSLVVGILVDDSIVVLENIYHHLERGVDKRTASVRGRNEIGFAALAITFVDVSVFLPLAMVGGIVGNIMRQFSVVVVVSTLMSLFVSFTLTPLLSSRFGKLERLTDRTLLGRFALWFEKFFHSFTENYIRALKWSFNHKKKVLAATMALFVVAVSFLFIGLIGFEFMTQVDQGQFAVTLEMAPGTPIEKTNRLSQQAEKIIGQMPEVKTIYVNVGASSEGLIGFASANSTEINVILLPRNQRKRTTDEVGNAIKEQLVKIPGAKVRINPIGIFGTANQTPVQLLLTGPNYNEVLATAKKVEAMVKTIPGTADVRLSTDEGKPETRIEIDRRKLVSFGLTLAEVGGALRIALTGDDDTKLRLGETDYNIRIVLDESDRSKTDEIGNISFINKKGQMIYLSQFANIYRSTGPTKLSRQSRSASVMVYSQAIGRPTGTIGQDIVKKLNELNLPAGITYSFQGDIKNQNESFGDLLLALFAGILFTYMVMVALYDSFAYPFVILFSIPLAFIGAFLALALAMKPLSIFSILGVIMLIGLVGKNAILLVDRANVMRAKGESVTDALVDAGRMRIRPIFMTTLTMIFSMLPIALSTSEGAEWKSGLAWALIGGLTSSLFLTLIIVPIMYSKVEHWKEAVPAYFKKFFLKSSKEDGEAFVK